LLFTASWIVEGEMKLQPYLYFDGDCRAAMDLYRQVLGGEIMTMITYGEGPPDLAGPEWRDRILHATLKIGGPSP